MWDIGQGVKLLTDSTCFPQWTATIFIPTKTSFEYKYVIVDKFTNDIRRWENLPNQGNRIMKVKQKGTFSATESEGILHTKIIKIRLNRSNSGIMKSKLSGYKNLHPKRKMTKVLSHTYIVEPRSKKLVAYKERSVSREEVVIPKKIEKKEDETNFLNIGKGKVKQSKKQHSYNRDNESRDYEENKLMSSPGTHSDEDKNYRASAVIKNIRELEQRVLSYQDVTKFGKVMSEDQDMTTPVKNLNPLNNAFELIQENFDEEIDHELTDNDCIIIVAIKLPFDIVRNKDGKLTLVLTTSLLYSKFYGRDPDSKIDEWWIGWAGYFPSDEEEKQEIINICKKKH